MKINNEINEYQKEIEKLKKKKRDLQNSLKGKERSNYRKQRANRLIQTGALAEKYFDLHNLNMEEREEVFKTFSTFVKSNKPNHLKK